MQIATRHVADTVIAKPAGRIDHQSAKPFEAALMPLVAETCTRHGSLVLDFSAVEYISSVGLRVLMVVAKQMRECNAQLRVAALNGVVAEIFAISRFDRILTVTATLDEALALGSAAALAQFREHGLDTGGVMRVRFWGTRGSLPVALTAAALREKLLATLRAARDRPLANESDLARVLDALPFAVAGTYGGHSSCVQLETGGTDYFVCDMGSGLRPFGQAATARRKGAPQTFHIFQSHLHWDHIMGLPFFVPAFIPGNRVVIYGSHDGLEAALRRQQDKPSFPVDFKIFGATMEFVHLEPGRAYEIAGVRVTSMLQRHAGDSYGYRFESQGKSVVYSTDSEHPLAQAEHTERFVNFFRDADLVIFDGMYSLADAISVKADWGHSSNIVGVELSQMAGVRHLCLYHHEPVFDDAAIDAVLAETRRLEEITRGTTRLDVSAAFDGMEIEL